MNPLKNHPSPNDSIDLTKIKFEISQILLGRESRLLDFSPFSYYFRIGDIDVETEDNYKGNLNALYSDGFYYHDQSQIPSNPLSLPISILDAILQNINIVFFNNVIKVWEKRESYLLEYIFRNYRIHKIKLKGLLFHKEGFFIPKQESLNSILGKESSIEISGSRIAYHLKNERKSKGLSRPALAAISNVSERTIGSIERGESFAHVSTLIELAKALQISVSKLL